MARNSDVRETERAAIDLLARQDVRSLWELNVERMACDEKAYVAWTDVGDADARVVRGPGHARIDVALRDRWTARGRWSIAHELGHWLLHREVEADALERIHGRGVIEGREYNYERQADQFASELLMPRAWFAERCTLQRPTIEDLDDLGAEYGTSLTATGKRYARFATAPCAMLECWNGVVGRATRSDAWRGTAVKGRAIEPTSRAAAPMRGERVDTARAHVVENAWGSEALGAKMTEHVIAVPESGTVLVWLWHEAT